MPASHRRLTLAALTLALTAGAPAAAQATGVAYVDGNEVWASSLDGTQKVRLSNGEGDWREVGQNDAGYVVGVRLESGKIASLSTFTIWKPDGTIKDFGPLAGKSNGGSEAYPLELELTPDAGLVFYGFSNLVYGYLTTSLTTGFFVLPSATRVSPVGGPLSVESMMYPSLVGTQVVGTPNRHDLAVQDPASIASTSYATWPGITVPSPREIDGIDVASTGRSIALGIYESGQPRRIIVIPSTPGLGLAPADLGGGDAGDCWLVNGTAQDASFSPDGTSLAWADPRGVVVAGTPSAQITTPPDNLCTLSRPATVISSTGKFPAIGGIDVGAILAARNPTTPGGGTGGASGGGATAGGGATTGGGAITGQGGAASTPAAVTFTNLTSVKIAQLGGKAGASVEVTPTVSGKATFTLTVDPKVLGKSGKKPVTIATGKGTLTSGKSSKVKLKANAAGKKAAKKLKKKTATLTVTIGSTTTATTVTLK